MSRVLLRLVCCMVALWPVALHAADPADVAAPLAGYDNGAFIRTEDGNFQLTINGSFQPRYRYENIKGVKDISTFELWRAKIAFTAELFQRFEAKTFIEHRTIDIADGANVPYFWAEGTYKAMPEFNVQFGMITLPLDFQSEVESETLAMTEQPITATQVDGVKSKSIERQSFGLPPTLGLRLLGDVGRFHYIVGVGNGGVDEHHFDPTARDLAFSGRFAVDLLEDPGFEESDLAYSERPKLQIGVGAGYEGKDAVDANINNVTLNWSAVGSAGLSFKWHGLSFVNEWYWRRLRIKTGNFKLDDVGYYAQAGYFVLPKKVEVVGRAVQMFRQGPDNNAYEFGGGINWYIHGNNVKWQTDFSRLLDYDATDNEGRSAFNRLRTMLSINI